GAIALAVVAVPLLFVPTRRYSAYPLLSLHAAVHHAATIFVQGVGLLALAVSPPGASVVSKGAVLVSAIVAALIAAALGTACFRLLRRQIRPERERIVRWLRVS